MDWRGWPYVSPCVGSWLGMPVRQQAPAGTRYKEAKFMEIIMKKLGEIREYANNPRKNEDAVQAVAASIVEFGFKVPIIVDATGEIVAGHTRYKAAKQIGLLEVPCIVANDLTPEQVKAFRLADNKVAEGAEWDEEVLFAELTELRGVMDMEQFGFPIELVQPPGDVEPSIKEASFSYHEQYGVIVMCESEETQEQAYTALTELGYSCKVVAV